MMTKREYFNKLFSLFESSGWRLFMEDLERDEKTLKESLLQGDGNDLYRTQGAIYYIGVVRNYEASIKHSYDDNEGELDAPLSV